MFHVISYRVHMSCFLGVHQNGPKAWLLRHLLRRYTLLGGKKSFYDWKQNLSGLRLSKANQGEVSVGRKPLITTQLNYLTVQMSKIMWIALQSHKTHRFHTPRKQRIQSQGNLLFRSCSRNGYHCCSHNHLFQSLTRLWKEKMFHIRRS